ncbi:MAG: hypothetical protein ACREAY_01720 [Nitrososphaera sp.]|uniref:hypothetical protein n=1 Tax=Nitrososphaera sp. TaxID=1971748 RepID=UPI003D6E888C
MADDIRLGILVAIVTIAIPTFVIASSAQAMAAEISPAASLAQNLPGDGVFSSQFQNSNPEEAMYMMYGAQAMEELDRCFEPKGPYAELCTGSVDLIVRSCNISADVRLEVCDDPRIKGLLQGA